MPFIRQTRDKRGFEHTYVMHMYHAGPNGPNRPRVLYLFRSPSNLRIGRQALDGEVMEALEHTHPDLSFDWGSLARDPAASRVAMPADRPVRRPTGDQRASGPPPARRAMEPTDGSLLARAIGVGEAARLRLRYRELIHRVGRRARTPDERDRLLDQARRLNPDDWTDEATIRDRRATIEAEWGAIGAELPSRRRGRRAGRDRPEPDRPSSAIMATGPVDREDGDAGVETRADRSTDRAGHGDVRPVGPDATPERSPDED